ncbi:MAG: hypothetical protein AAFN92_15235 [Bacteroidota bacterium]
MDKPKETGNNEQHLKSWLNNLQQESWQLELIVSGIIIFLLLQAYEPFVEFGDGINNYQNGDSDLITPIITLLLFTVLSYFALVAMFLIHLILRGVWIGAIGLRSVSGDFDLDELRYQERYVRFLRQRLGSFDDYLLQLERHASLAFSLAFLLFFTILSFGLFFAFFIASAGVINFLGNEVFHISGQPDWVTYVAVGLVLLYILLYMLGGLLYLVDFLTMGWVKRRHLIRKVYYPVYRWFGWITLARFYRPLYYNIIDNAFGRRLVWRYLLAAFALSLLTQISLHPFAYFPISAGETASIDPRNYLDGDEDEEPHRDEPTLGSRFAREDYLEVFIPYDEDNDFTDRYPDLTPVLDYGLVFLDPRIYENDEINYDTLLAAQTSMYRLRLNDSLLPAPQWYFYEHPQRKLPGYLYDLPVYDLPRGTHVLHVDESSRPEELPPEPLTEPYVIVSHHTAPHFQGSRPGISFLPMIKQSREFNGQTS